STRRARPRKVPDRRRQAGRVPRTRGIGLVLAAASWFPIAWAIGIAPVWFCLVGLVGALPFALTSRALARFDKQAGARRSARGASLASSVDPRGAFEARGAGSAASTLGGIGGRRPLMLRMLPDLKTSQIRQPRHGPSGSPPVVYPETHAGGLGTKRTRG